MRSKILVAENRDSGYSVRQWIDSRGRFVPLYVHSLKEAVEVLKQHPDVFAALIDLVLPDAMQGEIVDLVLGFDVPAIVLTSDISDDFRDAMLRKPIVDYVIVQNDTDVEYAVSLLERLVYYHKKKVLVVDDSTTYRTMMATFLEELLFDVYQAKSGTEALNIIDKNPDIKAVLIDYRMPEMDGLELLREIRKEHNSDRMSIIAVTGHDAGIHAKFLKHGADDFLSKPFTKEEFNCSMIRSLRIMEQFERLEDYIAIVDKYVLTLNTDTEGNIVYVSDAMAATAGYKKEEMVGENHRITRHPDMPDALFGDMWRTIIKGEDWHGEIKNAKKNGGHYWVEANIHPVFDNSDFCIGYTSTSIDITDRKKLEEMNATLEVRIRNEVEKNIQQQALLIQHSKMAEMGSMIGSIAHQWKQPLNSISLVTSQLPDMLEEGELSQETMDEMSALVLRQVRYMQQTIDDFQSFFKPSKTIRYVSIKQSVERILNILNLRITPNNIQVEMSEEDCKIATIRNELDQVLFNIINNAVDALLEVTMETPKIVISMTDQGERIEVSIWDNAPGIPEKMLDKIFEPYFSTKGESGTGLGLYICKLIVEQSLHGRISVANIDSGVAFIISLPK